MTRHRGSFAHLLARQLASAHLDDVPLMVIDSLSAQKRLIEAGLGIALLPESAIQDELRLGTLQTIDVPRLQTTVPVHVLHRKNALFYRTLNGAQVGDLFMSLIHTCQLCGVNSFYYLLELQRHAKELAARPAGAADDDVLHRHPDPEHRPPDADRRGVHER